MGVYILAVWFPLSDSVVEFFWASERMSSTTVCADTLSAPTRTPNNLAGSCERKKNTRCWCSNGNSSPGNGESAMVKCLKCIYLHCLYFNYSEDSHSITSSRRAIHFANKTQHSQMTLPYLLYRKNNLTLILLMWRIWWAPINASKWQMGFNLVFKGLNLQTCIF